MPLSLAGDAGDDIPPSRRATLATSKSNGEYGEVGALGDDGDDISTGTGSGRLIGLFMLDLLGIGDCDKARRLPNANASLSGPSSSALSFSGEYCDTGDVTVDGVKRTCGEAGGDVCLAGSASLAVGRRSRRASVSRFRWNILPELRSMFSGACRPRFTDALTKGRLVQSTRKAAVIPGSRLLCEPFIGCPAIDMCQVRVDARASITCERRVIAPHVSG